ncbi:MFS glucose transporter mfs1 [Paramyrothecium foliicola]|nr:MFS glucose transporter mfs1 [Paramyrothecium foliicola]
MYQMTNVYLICALASLGGALFGFDISSMSGVLATQAYRRFFDNPSPTAQGGITAAMPAGSLFGSLVSSALADRLSRKTALQVGCGLWIVGSVLQCAAQGVPMLCVGRVVAGLCVGITSSIVPVYQAEIAPKEIRGRVVSLQQWAITWGILIQFFIQYAAAQTTGDGPSNPLQSTAAFRIPWGVQMIPAAVLLGAIFFFPHSPRWLAAQDRWDEALEVLARLHGGGDLGHPKVLAQYREIEHALRAERRDGDSWWALLTRRKMVKRLVLGMSIQAWSQLCGMNIMMYYIVYIMEGAQIASPLLTASIQYIINVVLTLPAILFLDKWGRRPSLIVGSFLMMTWLLISGASIQEASLWRPKPYLARRLLVLGTSLAPRVRGKLTIIVHPGALQQRYGQANTDETRNASNRDISWLVKDNRAVSMAIVACSYLFVSTFSATWGPTPWLYAAEIYPGKIRTKAVSLSTATNWLCNMALAFAVPPLREYLGLFQARGFTSMANAAQTVWKINYKMYYIFGALNGFAFFHMFFTAYETKGYTLEEMDDVFDSGMPAWRKHARPSRLEALEEEIARGSVKVETKGSRLEQAA